MRPTKIKRDIVGTPLKQGTGLTSSVTVNVALREDGTVGCSAAVWSPDTHQFQWITLPSEEWYGTPKQAIITSLLFALNRLDEDPEFARLYPR